MVSRFVLSSEFLATQNRHYFWSLINDVSSFDLFTPDARRTLAPSRLSPLIPSRLSSRLAAELPRSIAVI